MVSAAQSKKNANKQKKDINDERQDDHVLTAKDKAFLAVGILLASSFFISPHMLGGPVIGAVNSFMQAAMGPAASGALAGMGPSILILASIGVVFGAMHAYKLPGAAKKAFKSIRKNGLPNKQMFGLAAVLSVAAHMAGASLIGAISPSIAALPGLGLASMLVSAIAAFTALYVAREGVKKMIRAYSARKEQHQQQRNRHKDHIKSTHEQQQQQQQQQEHDKQQVQDEKKQHDTTLEAEDDTRQHLSDEHKRGEENEHKESQEAKAEEGTSNSNEEKQEVTGSRKSKRTQPGNGRRQRGIFGRDGAYKKPLGRDLNVLSRWQNDRQAGRGTFAQQAQNRQDQSASQSASTAPRPDPRQNMRRR